MDRGVEFQPRKTVGNDLEQYRRLVELQKQMIELSRQNKLTEQHCAALRERVGTEVVARVQGQTGLRQLIRQKAKNVMKRLTGFTAVEPNLNNQKIKIPSPC